MQDTRLNNSGLIVLPSGPALMARQRGDAATSRGVTINL